MFIFGTFPSLAKGTWKTLPIEAVKHVPIPVDQCFIFQPHAMRSHQGLDCWTTVLTLMHAWKDKSERLFISLPAASSFSSGLPLL